MAALLLAGCGGAGAPADQQARSDKVRITAPAVTDADLAQLASDNRHFAIDLYQALAQSHGGNLVFAPESISIALAMLFGGAAGTTAAEMATALQFALPPERLHPAFDALDLALASRGAAGDAGAFRLELANAVWAQRDFTFMQHYLDLLAEDYGAGVHLVDFVAAPDPSRLTINRWVSDRTAGKIPDLLAPGTINADTRLVLTNAVYFRADWLYPFSAMSPPGTFHAAAGPVTVPMMSGPESVPQWTGAGYQAAAVPYLGNAVTMVLIVPDAGTFDAFEQGLTAATLDGILAASAGAQAGALSMPRFKIELPVSLKGVLSQLGMQTAFAPAEADLSGIDGARDLFVEDVIHRALIAVDEKGTEAAAATAVIVGTTSAALRSLLVDRPFLFAIRDDATASILFLGRVLDPSM
jgi:serpin B